MTPISTTIPNTDSYIPTFMQQLSVTIHNSINTLISPSLHSFIHSPFSRSHSFHIHLFVILSLSPILHSFIHLSLFRSNSFFIHQIILNAVFPLILIYIYFANITFKLQSLYFHASSSIPNTCLLNQKTVLK